MAVMGVLGILIGSVGLVITLGSLIVSGLDGDPGNKVLLWFGGFMAFAAILALSICLVVTFNMCVGIA